ncbi:hypothetical protein B1808_08170 [Pseudofulvimonas gallinarii]|jgi:hypothetical protein|nr:hypothetical protein B1808_08170 [Pseudofulvimonas gallinarii]
MTVKHPFASTCLGFCLSTFAALSSAGVPDPALADEIADPEATGGTILLQADFNALPLDTPIGQGGAAAGQPFEVPSLLSAIVRNSAFPTPSLDIGWAGDPITAATVRFSFLGEQEVTDGLVDIRIDLVPGSWSQYNVYLREHGGAARSYSTITLGGSGGMTISDAAGQATSVGGIWSPGSLVKLHWRYDMDQRIYTLWVNDVPRVTDRAFGVAPDGRGIGGLLVGMAWNTPTNSLISVDNIDVRRIDDVIFADSFEPASPTASGSQH